MTSTLRASVRRLRSGIVPLDDVERLSVGYDSVRQVVSTALADLASKGSHQPLFVRGEWGTGKSHLLEFIRAAAARHGVAHAKVDLNARNAPLNYPQRFYPWVAESLTMGATRGLRRIIEAAFTDETKRNALIKFSWAPASGKLGAALRNIVLQSKNNDDDYLTDDPAWGIVMGTDLPWSDGKRVLALERFAALAQLLRCIRAGGLVLVFDEVETLDQLWNRLSRTAAYETLGTITSMEASWAVFGITRRFDQSIRRDLGYGILNYAPPLLARNFLENWSHERYPIVTPPQLTENDAANLAQLLIELYSAAYPSTRVGKDSASGLVSAWTANPARNQRRLIRSIIDALDDRHSLAPFDTPLIRGRTPTHPETGVCAGLQHESHASRDRAAPE